MSRAFINGTPLSALTTGGGAPSIGGDGLLGNVTILVSAALSGVKNYQNLTINPGVVITPIPGSNRALHIKCSGNLVMNGTIDYSGENGGPGAASTGVNSAAGGTAGLFPGGPGSNGPSSTGFIVLPTSGAFGTGSNPVAPYPAGAPGGAGGAGGGGGAGDAGQGGMSGGGPGVSGGGWTATLDGVGYSTGGAAGTSGVANNGNGGVGAPGALLPLPSKFDFLDDVDGPFGWMMRALPGAGGASGAPGGTGGGSLGGGPGFASSGGGPGGGAAGGGLVLIEVAGDVLFGAASQILSYGGDGGNGGAGANQSPPSSFRGAGGGGGGGGAGGGGAIVIFYAGTLTDLGATFSNGSGAGGLGGAGGTNALGGTGAVGGVGGPGHPGIQKIIKVAS